MSKLPTFADLFFCKQCISCGETIPLFSGKDFCSHCDKHIVKNESEDFMLYRVKKVKSLFAYEGSVRKALIRFKYRNCAQAGKILGKELAEVIKKDQDFISADFVVNVPNGNYDTERYYNQSMFLAKVIAKECGIKFMPNALKKKKRIKSQLKCRTRAERKENIKNAFSPTKGLDLNGKTVLVIDDITTTGATLNECAKALENAGAKTVYAATVARTLQTMSPVKIKLMDADIVFTKKPTVHYKFFIK